ncbi:MAG: AI-2E family transporter [Myxococcaceae bacterium]|nr:AI-2E family transporter [Myxococcaceae bacterium]MCI0671346.1 AI-2E family transporter [Myxococcaceae bacterium]
MGGLGEKKWSNAVFVGLFALALVLFARIVLPFLMPVLLGGFLVVLLQPLHGTLRRVLPHRPALAAGLSTAAVFVLVLVPLALVGWLVARELFLMADGTGVLLDRGELERRVLAFLPHPLRRVLELPGGEEALQRTLVGAVSGGASLVRGAVETGTAFALDVFLMTVATYYFFLDGRRLVAELARLSPLDPRYYRAFCQEFTDVAHAIVYGSTLTALAQAAVGMVGLFIAGVPHPAVWGMAMVLVAFIPVGGTALVWGPLGIYLLLVGRTSEGLFLLAWGAVLVSSVDNLVRPWLWGTRMALHPLLIFLSMFGGISVFGIKGLLVGPLIGSLFMSMVRIYRRDFLRLPETELPEAAPVSAPTPAVDAHVVSTVPAGSAVMGGHPGDLG